MTTTVTITSAKPNHNKVGARIEYVNPDGTLYENAHQPRMIVLDDGESTTMYVHDGARIVITEVKKD